MGIHHLAGTNLDDRAGVGAGHALDLDRSDLVGDCGRVGNDAGRGCGQYRAGEVGF